MVPDQALEMNSSGYAELIFTPTTNPLGRFSSSVSGTYHYYIDWGDGTTDGTAASPLTATTDFAGSGSLLSAGSFGCDHKFYASGVYSVSTTVLDSSGGTDSQTMQVTVDSNLAFQSSPPTGASANGSLTYTLPTQYFTGAARIRRRSTGATALQTTPPSPSRFTMARNR